MYAVGHTHTHTHTNHFRLRLRPSQGQCILGVWCNGWLVVSSHSDARHYSGPASKQTIWVCVSLLGLPLLTCFKDLKYTSIFILFRMAGWSVHLSSHVPQEVSFGDPRPWLTCCSKTHNVVIHLIMPSDFPTVYVARDPYLFHNKSRICYLKSLRHFFKNVVVVGFGKWYSN